MSRRREAASPLPTSLLLWSPTMASVHERSLQNREAMLARIAQLRALEQRAADRSAEAQALFEQRGQLLPRERVGLLLDPGAPWLPLCSLAGYLRDRDDP